MATRTKIQQHLIITADADLGWCGEFQSPALVALKAQLGEPQWEVWNDLIMDLKRVYCAAIIAQAEQRGLVVHQVERRNCRMAKEDILLGWRGDPTDLVPEWEDVLDAGAFWEDAKPRMRGVLVHMHWFETATAFMAEA